MAEFCHYRSWPRTGDRRYAHPVYDIVDYLEEGCTPRLSRRSSASACARLTRHFAISRSMRKKSCAEYQRILARAAKGNPPQLQSQLDAGHARFLEHVRERARASGRGNSDESNPDVSDKSPE